jgi:hypothetical protein
MWMAIGMIGSVAVIMIALIIYKFCIKKSSSRLHPADMQTPRAEDQLRL